MAKCRMCGKQGLFLQVDSRGLCKQCAKTFDRAKEIRRRMLEVDFPSAKEYLSNEMLKTAQRYYAYDNKEVSRKINGALAKYAIYSQNSGLDENVYKVLLLFVAGDSNKRAEILQGIRYTPQIEDDEDYIDFLASMVYDLDKVKIRYERLSAGVNNLG